jgi:hypothetical protein
MLLKAETTKPPPSTSLQPTGLLPIDWYGGRGQVTTAPFSWKPDIVEIAAAGTLGYTEGPATTSSGISETRLYTTWQRQAHGGWLVIFDNGYRVCR